MKVLRIVLDGEEKPEYTITKAFEQVFGEVETVWWEQYTYHFDLLNTQLKRKLESAPYDMIFMQLQAPHIIYPSTLEAISKRIPIFNWTGDVREDNIDNYIDLAPYCITLYSNSADVVKMQQKGHQTDFLQTGYDHKHYFDYATERQNKIVFIGSNYENAEFPQTRFRKEMVRAMMDEFGQDFEVYGNNWYSWGRPTKNKEEEREIYNNATIAINTNHINLPNYYSDRQLRAMACGCLVLSEYYEGIETEFPKCVVPWKTRNELIVAARLYLQDRDAATYMGEKASNLVYENCRWVHRAQQLKNLYHKYKKTV